MKTGDTLGWAVFDPNTNQILAYFNSRASARDVAQASGCRIARVIVSK